MTHPDQSEQQLRRALRTMNDLQPPADELFVQRAVIRGRARTNRRRNALVAAAAALVVVAGGGGAWLLQGGLPGAQTASPASAPEVMSDSGSQGGAPEGGAGGREQPTFSAGPDKAPVPSAAAGSDWFVGPLTPQRAAIEALAPELTTAWASTFSGAWAKDVANQRIVVALTHPDLDLERWISANVRDATAVEFVTATHSYADKAALVRRISADARALAKEGIVISTVRQDFPADRVAIAASGTDAEARLKERYGADWVTVTPLPAGPGGTLLTPPPR